jgi:hypothetical protein
VAKGSDYARDPIKYWVELQDRYSNLSKLALDVLSRLVNKQAKPAKGSGLT